MRLAATRSSIRCGSGVALVLEVAASTNSRAAAAAASNSVLSTGTDLLMRPPLPIVGAVSMSSALRARLTLPDARDLIRADCRSNGGCHGNTHTRPHRTCGFGPRVRLRRGWRADGTGQPGG